MSTKVCEPRNFFPLFCWDVISSQRELMVNTWKKVLDINELSGISEKKGWVFDWNYLSDKDYDAIVITDTTRKILWVNDGFREMTGYPKSFALGRTPSFLQGKETREASRQAIRNKLSTGDSFTQQVINYKQDKSPYVCEITVYPVKNRQHEIAAFLALEREIRQAG
nr:PAS domain-containing protein [Cytophagales bacterium]